MALLTNEYKLLLDRLVAEGSKEYTEIYNVKRDTCCPSIFHEKCDNVGPTVTLVRNAAGDVFGGYTAVSWISGGTSQPLYDHKAFLFVLKSSKGTECPHKFAIIEDSAESAILEDEDTGPSFGSGPDLQTFEGQIEPAADGSLPLNMKVENQDYEHTHTGLGDTIDATANALELAVFSVRDSRPGMLAIPWRKEPIFDTKYFDSLSEEITTYSPLKIFGIEEGKLDHVNIQLVGQVGSGKSSFINTFDSCFRGHPSVIATAGSRGKSVTLDLRQYTFLAGDNRSVLNIRFWDSRGLGDGFQLSKEFSPLCDGHVCNKYVFNPMTPINSQSVSYRREPRLSDKVHCIVYVMDASKSDTGVDFVSDPVLQEMKAVQEIADQKGIPQIILLNKVEDACELTKTNLSDMFRSEKLHQLCIHASKVLGLTPYSVLPMKNHFDEPTNSEDINILALHNVRHMLRAADDYLRINYLDELRSEKYEFPPSR